MKVLASCDSKYFEDHYSAFYNSAVKCGYDVHINIINPTDKLKNSNIKNVSYSYGPNTKVFFACNRFLIAKNFLEDGVLITDIDCFFNKRLPDIKEDIGLFLRPQNPLHMKVAAGILWLNDTEKAKLFIENTEKRLENPTIWYEDQIALHRSYRELKKEISCFKFNISHMDWEFSENSYIWTGKGNRKYKNKKYLKRKEELE